MPITAIKDITRWGNLNILKLQVKIPTLVKIRARVLIIERSLMVRSSAPAEWHDRYLNSADK